MRHRIENEQMKYEEAEARRAWTQAKHEDLYKKFLQVEKEQKYLGKKYIAFLIYKGWTATKQKIAAEKLRKNKEIIAE